MRYALLWWHVFSGTALVKAHSASPFFPSSSFSLVQTMARPIVRDLYRERSVQGSPQAPPSAATAAATPVTAIITARGGQRVVVKRSAPHALSAMMRVAVEPDGDIFADLVSARGGLPAALTRSPTQSFGTAA